LEGDVLIQHLLVENAVTGPLACHFVWRGSTLEFTSLNMQLPSAGTLQASGTVDLASYAPAYKFDAQLRGLLWHGGVLDATATFQTMGAGADLLRHSQAAGTFTGYDVALSSESVLKQVTGNFDLSFDGGWPNLRLTQIQAEDAENSWSGSGTTQSDGRLILDLERAGQQRRIVSSLEPLPPVAPGIER
jgi:hypothetical protein